MFLSCVVMRKVVTRVGQRGRSRSQKCRLTPELRVLERDDESRGSIGCCCCICLGSDLWLSLYPSVTLPALLELGAAMRQCPDLIIVSTWVGGR